MSHNTQDNFSGTNYVDNFDPYHLAFSPSFTDYTEYEYSHGYDYESLVPKEDNEIDPFYFDNENDPVDFEDYYSTSDNVIVHANPMRNNGFLSRSPTFQWYQGGNHAYPCPNVGTSRERIFPTFPVTFFPDGEYESIDYTHPLNELPYPFQESPHILDSDTEEEYYLAKMAELQIQSPSESFPSPTATTTTNSTTPPGKIRHHHSPSPSMWSTSSDSVSPTTVEEAPDKNISEIPSSSTVTHSKSWADIAKTSSAPSTISSNSNYVIGGSQKGKSRVQQNTILPQPSRASNPNSVIKITNPPTGQTSVSTQYPQSIPKGRSPTNNSTRTKIDNSISTPNGSNVNNNLRYSPSHSRVTADNYHVINENGIIQINQRVSLQNHQPIQQQRRPHRAQYQQQQQQQLQQKGKPRDYQKRPKRRGPPAIGAAIHPAIANNESLSFLKDINETNFDCDIFAKFYIIKSYSEDDVHKSIKYSIWTSTDNGNDRLDKAYNLWGDQEPIYLFFSVNASGQFVGVAQMMSPLDFSSKSDYWHQDKWNGKFSVKWIFIKDIPNSQLRHIRLTNNDNKPVTNSRDTQEILLEPGREMLKIFRDFESKTSILDDFEYYNNEEEDRKVKEERSLKASVNNKGNAQVNNSKFKNT